MGSVPSSRASRVAVVASDDSFEAVAPLASAYERRGRAVDHVALDQFETVSDMPEVEGVLLLGNPRNAPGTALSGVSVRRADGRHVPVGWVPAVSHERLRVFAEAAAQVHDRAERPPSLMILGQRTNRYIRLSERIDVLLQDSPTKPFRWTSERVIREDMVKGFAMGLGVAMYLGHGRPAGWVGYRDVQAKHFVVGEPVAALLSLTCRTASRWKVGLSFSEQLVLDGRVAASIGAVETTKHLDNTRWAVRVVEVLKQGEPLTVGELTMKALAGNGRRPSPYRIVGDPLAPCRDHPRAQSRAVALSEERIMEEAV